MTTELIQTYTRYSNGDVCYYRNNKLHREDGPAIIFAAGEQRWYIDGRLHREDGPAIIYANGYEEWYHCGMLHRDDGPATKLGETYGWWLNNKQYTFMQYLVELSYDPTTQFMLRLKYG